MKHLLTILAVAMTAVVMQVAGAADVSWTGTGGVVDWNATTWSTGTPPGATDTIEKNHTSIAVNDVRDEKRGQQSASQRIKRERVIKNASDAGHDKKFRPGTIKSTVKHQHGE